MKIEMKIEYDKEYHNLVIRGKYEIVMLKYNLEDREDCFVRVNKAENKRFEKYNNGEAFEFFDLELTDYIAVLAKEIDKIIVIADYDTELIFRGTGLEELQNKIKYFEEYLKYIENKFPEDILGDWEVQIYTDNEYYVDVSYKIVKSIVCDLVYDYADSLRKSLHGDFSNNGKCK